MTSVLPGASTLDVEVTNVSTHGFWLMLGAEELFVPFSEFPWFKDAPIAKLTKVERPESERRVPPASPRTQPS